MKLGHTNGARYKKLVKLPSEPGGCWEWIGTINPRTGYGKKQWHGRSVLAHRWVWQMLFGKIEAGLTIDHLCGNRRCVNPFHLEPVTQTENVRRGKVSKLSREIARAIKHHENRKRGEGARLAREHGVSTSLIHDIWRGRAWADL